MKHIDEKLLEKLQKLRDKYTDDPATYLALCIAIDIHLNFRIILQNDLKRLKKL